MNAEIQEVQAGPVVRVARDLREIVELSMNLRSQAVNKANQQLDGFALPGGFAMVSLTPVANIEAWEHQYEGYERSNAERPERPFDLSHIEDEDDTWEPALQTLRYWSDQYRKLLSAEWDHIPTINTEAKFLAHQLNWIWENEPGWDHFASDINKVRTRLENILYAGKRAERTRVNCTSEACERKPRLLRVYAPTAVDDHYKCPACKNRYTPQQYARAKLQHLSSEGAERHVKMQDARDAIDRPERTWAKWLRLWYVRSYRDPITGQVWVWWPDVREADLTTQRRKASA